MIGNQPRTARPRLTGDALPTTMAPRRGTVFAGGVAALLLVMGTGQALADLKLCNATSSRIGVAIGYEDPKGWSTEGWWNIASQTCETLLKGRLGSRFYYVHAVDYDRGGEWGGTNMMCTADKAFTIRGVEECPRRGFKQTGFFEVDTKDSRDWTIRLTDPGEGSGKGR